MIAIPLHNSHSPVRHHSLGHRLSQAAQRAFATVQVWHRRIRERDELARLDDRILQDIGISRADALYLGGKPFWKE